VALRVSAGRGPRALFGHTPVILPAMRALFTLQYLGTRYAGWQRQINALAIQQVFEEALATLAGADVRAEAAGRTDTGVHARAQRVHADLPRELPPRALILGLNNLLPRDIRVTDAFAVAPRFHARFQALGKTYRYQIANSRIADVFLAPTHLHVARDLDIEAMRSAAAALVGRHDFRSFTVASPGVSSTWRTIESIAVDRAGELISIEITADGFLRNMVRRITGSLLEIGTGRITPEEALRALEPEYGTARWTAPAHGLILEHVRYDEASFSAPQPTSPDRFSGDE
jgi:tRNA pseudouridine38-40 synthase